MLLLKHYAINSFQLFTPKQVQSMDHQIQKHIEDLPDQISGLTIGDSLRLLLNRFPGKVCFSTSFGMEDQVISDFILGSRLPIPIFTLDTGRLFGETYSVWSNTNEKYITKIQAYFPDWPTLEEHLNSKGPNAFYESIENRKECCHIRKVEPLKRALKGQAVWVTGLRSAHSPERQDLKLIEWDENNQILKYSPLLHWTTEEVKAYIQEHNVPYNILHDRGFVSIGCAPCTRAVRQGESFRAGRWWWEDNNKKECGLHVK
jgi:phosphoadenosine phosphosulfate reductase